MQILYEINVYDLAFLLQELSPVTHLSPIEFMRASLLLRDDDIEFAHTARNIRTTSPGISLTSHPASPFC